MQALAGRFAMDKHIISSEGFKLEKHEVEHFSELESVIKNFTEDYDIKNTLIKVGNLYEALVCARLNSINFGIYQKSISISSLADYLHSRLKKECRKAWKHNKSFYVKFNSPQTKQQNFDLMGDSYVETHNYNFF